VDKSTLEILERRLLREYLDLPGLSLTLPQAARLLLADASTCQTVLNSLMDTRCLTSTAAGRYVRGTSHDSLEAWKSHTRRRLTAPQHAPAVPLTSAKRFESRRVRTVGPASVRGDDAAARQPDTRTR
jgi:hypothetical protein